MLMDFSLMKWKYNNIIIIYIYIYIRIKTKRNDISTTCTFTNPILKQASTPIN